MLAPAVSTRRRLAPGISHVVSSCPAPWSWLHYAPYLALSGYAGALWFGTHLSPSHIARIKLLAWSGSDKVCHYFAYVGLTLLVLWMLLASGPLQRRFDVAGRGQWWPLAACAAIALCGVIDELTQPFARRTCDWRDWLANVAGIATAAIVCRVALWFKQRGAAAY